MRWQITVLVVALATFGTAMRPRADEAAPKKPLPAGKPCQGALRLSGKTYKFEHIAAYPIRLYDNDATAILLSDQPISAEKLKAALAAGKGSDDGFSLFQPHAKITFDKDGKAIFCSAWAANRSISVSGGDSLKGNLTVKGSRVQGSTSLTYGDKPEQKEGFDASFDVALLPNPAAKAAPQVAATGKPQADSGGAPAPAKSAAAVSVSDLPIPKDATDIEYKQLVGHIGFKSKSDVKTLSAALAKNFKQQGWQADDDDLVTPKSAILNRTKGAAKLTLFVKPDGAGSKVTIMSEGLAWGDDAATEDDDE